ncbi:MAG: CHAT domain-containing protein [Limnospira sp.]
MNINQNNRLKIFQNNGFLLAIALILSPVIFPFQAAHTTPLYPQAQIEKIQRGNQELMRGNYREAVEVYREALPSFREENDGAKIGEILLNLGTAYRILSQYDSAREAVSEALEIAQKIGDRNLEAAALMELGVIDYSRSEYPEALELYDKAIAISREIDNREIEGRTLDHVGVVYRQRGDFQKALEFHQQALEILQEINLISPQALVLNNIGIVYERLGDYPQAIAYNERGLSISREYGDRNIESRILLSLGVVDGNRGNYRQAREVFEAALILAEQIGNRASLGRILNNLGGVENEVGESDRALDYYQKSLEIRREIGDRIGEGVTLSSIGLVYRNLGQYNRGLDYYWQALEITRKVGDRPGEAYVLMSIGGVYSKQGKYTEALQMYREALAIREGIGDRAGQGYTLNSMGALYYTLGQFSEALNDYEKALEIRREIGDRAGEAQSLNNIGLIYEVQGQNDRALDFYRQSLDIRREIGDRAGEGNTLNNIGLIYNFRRDFDRALETYEEALKIRREIGDIAGEGTTLNNLGSVHRNRGDYDSAIAAYQQSLVIFQEIGNPEGERSTLSSIGLILESKNQIELAIIFYKKSVNVTESIRQNLGGLSGSQQQSYTETVAATYRRLSDLLLQQNRVLEAQQVLDLLKVQELEDYLKNVRGNQQTSQGVELLPQEQQIYEAYAVSQERAIQLGRELARLRQIPPGDRTEGQQERIAEIDRIQQQIRQNFNEFIRSPEVAARIQELSTASGGQNIDLPNLNLLQRQLQQIEPTAVLLYPLILEDRVELVLVTPFSPPINRSFDIDREELNRAVLKFRQGLTNPVLSQNAVINSAQKLYDILIKPIENDLIQADAKVILYAPDGVLRYVPIAGLHDGDRWLIERFAINNITAASLTNLNPVPPDRVRVLAGAFATGSYEFEVGTRQFLMAGLPFTAIEVDRIAQKLPDTTKLVDEEFNRDATISQLNDYSIVHFATHAAFVPGKPEDSFILFGDGDRATLREVETWNLPNVSLIILSACQTAVGGMGNGEEILGLGYQMQQAGVLATVASLWVVDDRGTQTLMDEFYQALVFDRKSPTRALQQAQINLIDRRGEESHPYYWAPFIAIGNGLFPLN